MFFFPFTYLKRNSINNIYITVLLGLQHYRNTYLTIKWQIRWVGVKPYWIKEMILDGNSNPGTANKKADMANSINTHLFFFLPSAALFFGNIYLFY